jgi:hypothetical protein
MIGNYSRNIAPNITEKARWLKTQITQIINSYPFASADLQSEVFGRKISVYFADTYT